MPEGRPKLARGLCQRVGGVNDVCTPPVLDRGRPGIGRGHLQDRRERLRHSRPSSPGADRSDGSAGGAWWGGPGCLPGVHWAREGGGRLRGVSFWEAGNAVGYAEQGDQQAGRGDSAAAGAERGQGGGDHAAFCQAGARASPPEPRGAGVGLGRRDFRGDRVRDASAQDDSAGDSETLEGPDVLRAGSADGVRSAGVAQGGELEVVHSALHLPQPRLPRICGAIDDNRAEKTL
mmetsp:Transcript_5674/g.12587  ORF Transcript_5674/g.12587 Transcript_5674/m.12587 type:complete len:233 (+) Transcript_5674:666-1364(+)